MPIGIVFRKFKDQRAGEDTEVARRGDVVFRRQPVRIDEMRLGHAEPAGVGVHQVGEALDRAADAFGDRHRHVVGRFHHQHLQGVVDGEAGADFESHLGRLLRRRVARYGQHATEADAAFLDGAQRGVGGHQFGDGGRIPRIGGVFRMQHLAGGGFDQQLRFGPGLRRAGKRQRCRHGKAKHQGAGASAIWQCSRSGSAPRAKGKDPRKRVGSIGGGARLSKLWTGGKVRPPPPA